MILITILTTNNMTVKTDAQLKTELDTTFYTNGANLSTGALTNTHLTNAIESKVSVIDAETINGVKTFGSFPVTPSSAPTTDYQVANKKYVDDNIISTKEVNVSLTAAQVATLGTVPVQLIAAPSANIFINVLNASVRIIPTTPLAVGSQELFILYHHTSQEVFKLHEAGVETGTEGRWIFTRVESVEVPDAEAIMLQLSGGTNPASGAATMEVTLYYRLETY